MASVLFISPRQPGKSNELEDALQARAGIQPERTKRNFMKFGSTLSLGSRTVKETMHAAIAQKNDRIFGIEVSALLKRERATLPVDKMKEHRVPFLVSRITSYLREQGRDFLPFTFSLSSD
jgi:hypothetical protein